MNIKSTHNLFHYIYSANLADNLQFCCRCWSFRTLAGVTISDFLPDEVFNYGQVQMSEHNQFNSIQFRTKEISVIKFHNTFLEFLRNDYFINISYRINSFLPSKKRTLLYFAHVSFSTWPKYFQCYRSIRSNEIRKITSGSSSMLYNHDIVSVD